MPEFSDRDLVAAVRCWTLWRSPRPVVWLLCIVFAVSIGAILPTGHIAADTVERFVALVLTGSLSLVGCSRMERARQTLGDDKVPNLLGCWTFAGALCLGHTAAALLVATLYAVQWGTQREIYQGRVHKYIFSAGTVILGAWAVQAVHQPFLAAVVYTGVNMALVAAVMVAAGARTAVRPMFTDMREQAVSGASLLLGFGTAASTDVHLAYGLIPVPVILTVQYLSLLSHSRRSRVIDSDTGVLTPRAWQALAALRLAQRKEALVIVVLVESFNERTPRDCAEVIAMALRPEDLVGRTQGGFTALVAEPGGALLADALSAHVHTRLVGAGIESIIGSAVTPDCGNPIDLQGLTVTASAMAIVRASISRV